MSLDKKIGLLSLNFISSYKSKFSFEEFVKANKPVGVTKRKMVCIALMTCLNN